MIKRSSQYITILIHTHFLKFKHAKAHTVSVGFLLFLTQTFAGAWVTLAAALVCLFLSIFHRKFLTKILSTFFLRTLFSFSLHNSRFISQARRTRHFTRSARRERIARRGEEKNIKRLLPVHCSGSSRVHYMNFALQYG